MLLLQCVSDCSGFCEIGGRVLHCMKATVCLRTLIFLDVKQIGGGGEGSVRFFKHVISVSVHIFQNRFACSSVAENNLCGQLLAVGTGRLL
jgi:hypothetical protein